MFDQRVACLALGSPEANPTTRVPGWVDYLLDHREHLQESGGELGRYLYTKFYQPLGTDWLFTGSGGVSSPFLWPAALGARGERKQISGRVWVPAAGTWAGVHRTDKGERIGLGR